MGTGICCAEGPGRGGGDKGAENTGRQKQEMDKSIGLRERPTPGQSSLPQFPFLEGVSPRDANLLIF